MKISILLLLVIMLVSCGNPVEPPKEYPYVEEIDSVTSVVHTEDGEEIYLFKCELPRERTECEE